MQRITITIEDNLLAEIDATAKARGYQNRSEIIRDLARAGLQQSAENADATGQCVAALVYVYDHAARDLSKRLDKYLTDRITFMSRNQLQRLIDEGGVMVNGRQPKASTVLHAGDEVEVVIPAGRA